MRKSHSYRERGASAVEYGLLISGIATIIAIAVYLFGGVVGEMFTDSCQLIKTETHSTADASCT